MVKYSVSYGYLIWLRYHGSYCAAANRRGQPGIRPRYAI